MPLDLGSITLQVSDGTSTLSIAIDWRHQLKNFLAERLPAEDILFARWIKPDVPNPLSCGNAPEYLTPPYPPLPHISIGELQWPTGASRYARALYAVDWETMKALAEYCWGYEPELDEDEEEIIPTDVPVVWGAASNYTAKLVINSEAEGIFRASMKILPPYRVPGTGIDLWLLPMVDARHESNDKVWESTDEQPEDWTTFLEDVGEIVAGSVICDPVPSAYEHVDPRLYKTIQPQRAAQILDVGALSVGLRVVRDPNTGIMRVLNATNSGNRRLPRLIAKGNGELLSGGLRGIGSLPEVADLYCQRNGTVEKKSSNITGGNVGYVRLPIWTTWEYTTSNESATTDFADRVTNDIAAWSNCGGQYCYPGAFDYLPSGFDDFLSIQIFETEQENYVFRSRIYELPNVFLPTVLLAGGLEPECGSSGIIEYTINSLSTATTGPYDGLVIASVTVRVADKTALIGTVVDVVDHSGCIFDEESMSGYTGWAAWGAAWSLYYADDCETLTPKHWYAVNRCCAANSGTYADECEE